MKHDEKIAPGLLFSVLLIACGCTAQQGARQTAPADANATALVLLTRGGCANTGTLRANLDDALRSLGSTFTYEVVDLDTLPEADARRGYPTPTLLHDNRDVFDLPAPRQPFPEPT